MKPHIEESQRFLRLADRDIYAFTVLKKEEDVHLSVVYFHAQQAVEKLLKAVLFSVQIEFRRTHDLTALMFLLQQKNIQIPVATAQLARLNPFAVTYRYDDMEIDAFRLTREEATEWLNSLRIWAESELNEHGDESDTSDRKMNDST